MKPRILLLPGNGGPHFEIYGWYQWVRDELIKKGFEVIAEDLPDPEIAHQNIWLPYIRDHFRAGADTIVIGHSSGGVAALRYLEDNFLLGAIVAGVNHTDLGMEEEKEAGYYDEPWKWNQIQDHAQWIVQFASQDDPFIPVSEARFIHEQINSEYHEFTDRGHFHDRNEFGEIIEVVLRKTA